MPESHDFREQIGIFTYNGRKGETCGTRWERTSQLCENIQKGNTAMTSMKSGWERIDATAGNNHWEPNPKINTD